MPREGKALARLTLTDGETALFCGQMAMIMRSGISAMEGLEIMRGDYGATAYGAAFENMRLDIEAGARLHQAMDKAGIFPKYAVDMAEIGGQTGRLDDVMASLGEYYERERSISEGIRSAAAYPLVMIAMMAVVAAVLVIKVLPVFTGVFARLGMEMPLFPAALVRIGNRPALAGGLLAATAIIIVLTAGTSGGKKLAAWVKTGIFSGRRLTGLIAAGRFASVMSLALSSGLDVTRSLEMAKKTAEHPGVRAGIDDCEKRVAAGEGFAEALAVSGVFTGIYIRMVSMGCRAGKLDMVMAKIAGLYREEADSKIDNIISSLEPALVAALSVIMGIILLSVIFPLTDIITSVG